MSSEVNLDNYDPMERSTQQNPFPYYAKLREEAPVYYHQPSGYHFISRMNTVLDVLSKPNLYSSQYATMRTQASSQVDEQVKEVMKDGYPMVRTMLTADPPAQTRYRKTIGRPFGHRRTKELEPIIRTLASDLLEIWPEDGPIAFLESFSLPLPIRAISHALGMSSDQEANIKRWSDDSIAALGTSISDERRLESARGVVESQKYWAARFEESRKNPIGDIVSNLVNSDFEDHTGQVRKLEVPEFISMMRQFMVAGNETTTKLLNEALRLLIENPEEWHRIKEDPGTIPAMVEEALRLSSPNQGLFRSATEDSELEGVKLPKGSKLWVIFGSANRDEKVFPDPDRFDPTRENLLDHVAFGKGTHLCPGAPLARLEAVVAFEEIVKRVESFEFAPGYEIEYEPSFILRGLTRMDVLVERCG